MIFIDLKFAFDSVAKYEIWNELVAINLPTDFVLLV